MSNEVYFNIENNDVFLKLVLVEYEGNPIFFLCSDKENKYYLSLCTDIEQEKYIVVRTNVSTISKMLHKKIDMREIIVCEKTFWEIVAESDVKDDVVIKKNMDQIKLADLPYENSYYDVVSDDVSEFREFIDNKLYSSAIWEKVSRGVEQGVLEENSYGHKKKM